MICRVIANTRLLVGEWVSNSQLIRILKLSYIPIYSISFLFSKYKCSANFRWIQNMNGPCKEYWPSEKARVSTGSNSTAKGSLGPNLSYLSIWRKTLFYLYTLIFYFHEHLFLKCHRTQLELSQDRCMSQLINGRLGLCVGWLMDGQTDGQMDERMDKQMNEWKDGYIEWCWINC